MTISYQHNTVTHNGQSYQLDDVRKWVVDNHFHALAGHHIKTKVKIKADGSGELSLSYDWKAILNEGMLRLFVLSKIIQNN